MNMSVELDMAERVILGPLLEKDIKALRREAKKWHRRAEESFAQPEKFQAGEHEYALGHAEDCEREIRKREAICQKLRVVIRID